MINYAVSFKSSAKKELAKLDKKIGEKVLMAVHNFANGKPCDVKKMQGMENNYRICVNDYRILIEIIIVDNVAQVYRIAHRKEVYQRMLIKLKLVYVKNCLKLKVAEAVISLINFINIFLNSVFDQSVALLYSVMFFFIG